MYIRLKQFLIEKGLKNKDVALKLGMSESNFSRKINNKKGADFSLIQVRKICKMYKLDPNIYFFSITSCLNDNKNNKKKNDEYCKHLKKCWLEREKLNKERWRDGKRNKK